MWIWQNAGEGDGDDGALGDLVQEAERHAAAAALVEVLVAPDVAATAAAGLNAALMQVLIPPINPCPLRTRSKYSCSCQNF